MKKILIFALILPFFAAEATPKTKFYNFDDLVINGEYKKPQIMYNDTQAKVRFKKLFNIKKNFITRVQDSKRDSSLR
jgi:hypothetical protein